MNGFCIHSVRQQLRQVYFYDILNKWVLDKLNGTFMLTDGEQQRKFHFLFTIRTALNWLYTDVSHRNCQPEQVNFPEGAPTPESGTSTYYFAKFLSKTAWKWKNWDRAGESVLAPPWIRHCKVSVTTPGTVVAEDGHERNCTARTSKFPSKFHIKSQTHKETPEC